VLSALRANGFPPPPEGSDLSGARLDGAKLGLVDIKSGGGLATGRRWPVNLSGAKLVGASLIGTNLRDANLAYADLSGADLTNAILIDANLTGAVLDGAKLEGAILPADMDDD
jgi:uncharacterized protein YjbI with pentapeptide repeats